MTLRDRLDEITYPAGRVPRHPQEIAALRVKYPHTIKVIEGTRLGLPSIEDYTCFMHALDIASSAAYVNLHDSVHGRWWADDKFVHFLIESNRLRPKPTGELVDGDLVLYFNEGRATHAGRLTGERVISKWGVGHLYEHGLIEVPLKYGLPRFFCPLNEQNTCDAFRAYVISEGASLPSGAKSI